MARSTAPYINSTAVDAAGNIYYYKNISYPALITNTVYKLDGNGNELWSRSLQTQYMNGSILPLPNGKLLVCENVFSMTRLDSQGNILWSKND